jgi:hypothetical protein
MSLSFLPLRRANSLAGQEDLCSSRAKKLNVVLTLTLQGFHNMVTVLVARGKRSVSEFSSPF